MRKAHSLCALIFDRAAKLYRLWVQKNPVAAAVAACFEPLEGRTFFNAVSLVNGVLNIQGNATAGSSLTVNLVNSGKSIDASADQGHAIIVALSSVKTISITGGSGADYIYVDQNVKLPVTINSGDGNDQIRGGGGSNIINSGNGNDWISGRGATNNIVAGNGNDTILGSTGNDTLTAGNGNDSIDGADGNDIITAGNGSDSLTGDAGNDTLTAGTGKDVVNGGLGDDKLTVGNGPSTVIPGSGTNYMALGGSQPIVIPSAGSNTVVRAGSTTTIPVAPPVTTPVISPVSTPTSTGSTGSTTVGSVGSTQWASSFAAIASGTAPRAVMQIMAPAPYVGIAVIARALNSTLGTGTPIDANYSWNFGDPSSQFNVLPGFNASHVYTNAGTYTITLTVTNNLHQTSTVSNTVTILGDNRRAIYVNAATGNDNNNGSINSPIKSATRALAMVADNTEIFFARGEEFSLGQAFKLNHKNVLVGAYGTGSKPTINYTAPAVGAVIFTTNSNQAVGVTVQDLTLTTLDGTQPTNTHMPMAVMAGGYDTSVLRCTFYYVEYDINASAAPTGLTAIGNDSPIKGGLQGYFLWSEGTDATVISNYVNGSVHEHIIRTSGASEMLITGNDFNNFDGKGCIEVHEGSWAWVSGNTVNSGDIRVGPLGLWGEPVSVGTSCVVVEGNYVINSDITIYPGAHDVSIRNNIISRNGSNMIDVLGQDGLGRQSSDIRILNNTGISTTSTGEFLKVENHVDGILLENNLLIQPSLAVGGYTTAPVYVSESNLSSFTYINGNVWQQPKTFYQYALGGINFVAPSYSINGYLTPSAWNNESVVGTDFFSNTVLSGYTPTSGLALTADAPISGVFTDINGKARPTSGSWSAGAVQH